MTAPYLDAMAARAAECAILADCAEDARIARWLRDLAAEIDGWRAQAVEAERTLDYIAEDERRAAVDAEAEARTRLAEQNPGRGPSPAANSPEHSPGCERSGPGHSLRTIDQVIAAAERDRRERRAVIEFPRDPRPAA